MKKQVYRFIIHSIPSDNHRKYYQWQDADIVIFLASDNHEKAESLALMELEKRNWSPIKFKLKDILIKERVQSEGGDLCAAYHNALNGEVFWMEHLIDIPFSTKNDPPAFIAPRLDESFIDKLITSCNGKRISEDQIEKDGDENKKKNADYLLGNFILELKDLQEEGLLVTTRQKKIAEIFDKYNFKNPFQQLDISILNDSDFLAYMDIVGKPIQKRIKDAAKQIKSTISHLELENDQGYIILLNSGYSSLPQKLLEICGERYSTKDTSRVKAVIAISTWVATNGFDYIVNFAFSPNESNDKIINNLREKFWDLVNELMTEWGRSGFQYVNGGLNPIIPINFTYNDKKYIYTIPKLESSIGVTKE